MRHLFDIYLTVYMENANSIGKMQTLEIMPPPVVLSSPPRLRFIFYFNLPLSLEATKYAGCKGLRLSVNYLTLLYVVDYYSLSRVSVNRLTLMPPLLSAVCCLLSAVCCLP